MTLLSSAALLILFSSESLPKPSHAYHTTALDGWQWGAWALVLLALVLYRCFKGSLFLSPMPKPAAVIDLQIPFRLNFFAPWILLLYWLALSLHYRLAINASYGLLLFVLILAWRNNAWPALAREFDWPLRLWMLACLLSALLTWNSNPNFDRRLFFLFALVSPLMAFWLRQLGAQRSQRVHQALSVVIAVFVVQGLLAIAQFKGIQPMRWLYPDIQLRVAPYAKDSYLALGTFHNRFTLAFMGLVPLTWAVLTVFEEKAIKQRILYTVGLGMALLAVALTYARSALLGWFIVSFVLLIVAHFSWRTLASLAVAIVLIALVAFSLPSFKTKMQTSFSVHANWDRLFIWSRAMEMRADHPYFGIGYHAYRKIVPTYYDKYTLPYPVSRKEAHNAFLTAWVEQGYWGLFLFIFLWAEVFARGFLALKTHTGLDRRVLLWGLIVLAAFWLGQVTQHSFEDDAALTIMVFALRGMLMGMTGEARAETATAGGSV